MSATLPDHVHHDVRMDGVYFCRCFARGSFVRALEPGHYSYCVMVRTGTLRFETDFPVSTSVELSAGDAIAVSGLAPHTFRSLATPPASAPDFFDRRPMTWIAKGEDVEIVLGVAPNEGLALGSLMVGPIVVRPGEHPGLNRRLWAVIDMVMEEYADASWIDRNLVIRRLAELMLLSFSRRVFDDRRDPQGKMRRPASQNLLSAINAFFRSPERSWNLADLAKAAGMSRTRFTEEFKLITGHSPGRIISRMRLTAIARRLVVEPLSIEAAADGAGYSSAAAFVRAFQREFGETPARWRRRRREDVARPQLAAVAEPAR